MATKEIYHKKVVALLEKNDWLSGGIEIVKLYSLIPLDREIRDTCALIFGTMLNDYPDFQPLTSEEFMWRGICLRDDRDIFETMKDFNTAVELNPQNHYAWKWKGTNLASYGISELYSIAKSDLIKAISICSISEYYNDLAKIYTIEEDYESALYYNLKAIELANNTDSVCNRKKGLYCYDAAMNYWNLFKFESATQMFKRAIELYEGHELAESYLNKIQQYKNAHSKYFFE